MTLESLTITIQQLTNEEKCMHKGEITDIPVLYKVYIIESERGWGTKVDDVKYIDTKENAMMFVREFNSKNNKEVVPDWYMYAEYGGMR